MERIVLQTIGSVDHECFFEIQRPRAMKFARLGGCSSSLSLENEAGHERQFVCGPGVRPSHSPFWVDNLPLRDTSEKNWEKIWSQWSFL